MSFKHCSPIHSAKLEAAFVVFLPIFNRKNFSHPKSEHDAVV